MKLLNVRNIKEYLFEFSYDELVDYGLKSERIDYMLGEVKKNFPNDIYDDILLKFDILYNDDYDHTTKFIVLTRIKDMTK